MPSPRLLAPPAALAQITGPDAGSIPELPAAPAHELWLLENPVPLAVVAGVAAVLLSLVLLRAGRRVPALLVVLAGLLLAAGAIAAGGLVTTPREIVKRQTAELVRATAAADADAMRRLLHPDASLDLGSYRLPGGGSISGREQIIGRASDIPRFVGRVAVLETRAGLDGPRVGRAQVRLRAFADDGRLLGHSWWGMDWQEHDGSWIAVGIEPLWLQGG